MYTTDKKSTGLDVLTGLDAGDLHIVGDISDSGRAKAITQNNLEIDIANSNNFVDTLVANNYFTTELAGDTNFITNLQTAGVGSTVDVQENGVSVENPVDTINIIAPSGTVTTPSAGVVDIDLSSLIGGGGGGGGTKLAIDTTQVIVTGTSETTLYTIPIPAGTLGTNDAIRFKVISSESTIDPYKDVTFRVKYGGTTMATAVISNDNVAGTPPEQGIILEGVIIADNATNAQKAQVQAFYAENPDGNGSIANGYGTATVDSTIEQNLIITAQNSATQNFYAEAIIVEKITDTGIQTKTVTLSNTDINGMYASPYTLVAAPGAGKVNVVESALFYFDYGTVQYTGGGNVSIIEETSGTPLAASFNDTFITAASNAIIQRNALAPVATSLTENKAIQLTNALGAFAAGDGTLKVVLNYRVITL